MIKIAIIRKLKSGKYRLYSRKKDKSGKRQNLGTFPSMEAAKKREQEIQYFKHQADDGAKDDKSTKALSKLSDIAEFLEKAGFIDAADKIYCAMDAIDGSLDDEDYIVDSITSAIPDVQMNYLGSGNYMMTGEIAGGSQNTLNIPEAEKVASLANKLDKIGLYDEADELDDILKEMLAEDKMLRIINDLEEKEKKRPKSKEKDKAGIGTLIDANGLSGVTSIDNQNSGMFQGLSDSYFYRGHGNLEGVNR